MMVRSTALAIAVFTCSLLACSPGWTPRDEASDAGAGTANEPDASDVRRDNGGSARVPDASPPSEPEQAPPTPARASIPTLGAPASVGSVRVSGELLLLDDGFEGVHQSCSKQQCLTGGVYP